MKTVPLWNVGLSLIGFFALVQALVLFPYLATSGAVLVQYVQGRALVLVITILITILPFGLLILLGVLSVAHPTAVARFLWPGAAAEGWGTGQAYAILALVRNTDQQGNILLLAGSNAEATEAAGKSSAEAFSARSSLRIESTRISQTRRLALPFFLS